MRGGLLAAVVGGVAFSLVHWSNTGRRDERETFRNEPVQVVSTPTNAPFSKARQEGVLTTAKRFVRTAVVREHVQDSWALTAPSLKTGYTRRSWATQDIPVQPYPVDVAKWKVDYSWVDVVGLKVALFPKRGSKVPAAVFDMELHAYGQGAGRRWLVDSWTPSGYRGVPDGPLGAPPASSVVEVKQGLPTHWLLLPLAVLAVGLLVPTTIGVRGWLRGRRALREYKSNLS